MACKINRNQSGAPVSVSLEGGQKSALFDSLVKLPHVEQEQALDAYKYVIHAEGEGVEPTLSHKSSLGNTFDTFKEALLDSPSGNIQTGYTTEQGFTSLIDTSSDSNPNTEQGYINSGIRKDLISENKFLHDGEYLLRGHGEMDGLAAFNTARVKQDLFNRGTGMRVRYNSDASFRLETKDTSNVTLADGTVINAEQTHEKLKKPNGYSQVSQEFEAPEHVALYAYTQTRSKEVSNNSEVNLSDESKQDLRVKLLNVLSSMGVSVTGLSSYISKYNAKEGQDPSIEALADIANKVVAFAEGKDTTENVSEEVSHFLIEAFEDQGLIDEILPQVEQTQEWADYSEAYRQKYSEKYQGQELENIVRREILGKILSNKIINSSNQVAGSTLLERLQQLFERFKVRVRALFTSEVKADMNKVLDDIATQVLNETYMESMNTDNFVNNETVLYSLETKKSLAVIKKAQQVLQNRIKKLRATHVNVGPDISNANRQISDAVASTLRNNASDLDTAQKWESAYKILGAVESQVKSTMIRLQDATSLTNEESILFDNLVNTIDPLLVEVTAIIDTFETMKGVDVESFKERSKNTSNDLRDLKGRFSVKEAESREKLADKIAEEYGLDEETKQRMINIIEGETKDISSLQKWFGSLEHSGNIYLGLLGKAINRGNTQARLNTVRDMNSILDGFTPEQEKWMGNFLERDSNGKITGFLINEYDFKKFYDEMNLAEMAAFNKATGLNYTLEEYLLDKSSTESKLDTQDKRELYNLEIEKWMSENTERRYTSEFYSQRTKLMDGVSQDTKDLLTNLSSSRFNILKKYRLEADRQGVPLDYTKLTKSERDSLDLLVQQRKQAKSLIDPQTGQPKTDPSEIKVANELTALDERITADIASKGKTRGLKSDQGESFFLKAIKGLGTAEEAFDFLMVNGGISFSTDFWDSLSTSNGEGIIDRLRATEADQSRVDELDNLLNVRREILKQHPTSNNPAEVNFGSMSPTTLTNFKKIETDIQSLFRELNSELEELGEETNNDPLATENTLNASFAKALKDSKLSRLDFILQHVTEANSESIKRLKRELEGIKLKGNTKVSMFVKNATGSEDLTDVLALLQNNAIDDIVADYGETKVLSYFKRFAPAGYDQFLNELKTDKSKLEDFVKNGADNFELNTKIDWLEEVGEEGDFRNENYIEGFMGGRYQPVLSKYSNKSFQDKFGVVNGQATKNQQEYALLEKVYEKMRGAYERYGELGSANAYRAPQKSKGTVDRVRSLFDKNSKGTIANTFKDIIYNRQDELAYGLEVDGEPSRIIPKFYINPLEETSDVSTDLVFSLGALVEASHTYVARNETIEEVLTYERQMLNTKFKGVSESAVNQTNAYKMFDEFLGAYFFGRKRNRKMEVDIGNGKKLDISKIMVMFDGFVRLMNLGFSLPVAFTSLTTGGVFLRLEATVGEHVHSDSVNWSFKKFASTIGKNIQDTGKLDKKSELHQFGERFGIYDISERLTSSGSNRLLRSGTNLPHAFSRMANLPVSGRIMFAVLDDFRVVDRKIINFNQFKAQNKGKFSSAKEAKKEWSKYRSESMYNLLEQNEETNTVEFKKESIDKVDGGLEYLEKEAARAQNLIRATNSNVDSVVSSEDKSYATRDFMLNFMLAHRGYFTIGMQRRFKREHFNFATGQVESGHWSGLSKFLINGTTKMLQKENIGKFAKVWKEEKALLSDNELNNLKRVITDMGVMTAFAIIGVMAAGVIDDDDDEYGGLSQFSAYIALRTANEVNTLQLPTIHKNVLELLETPFIAQKTASRVLSFKSWGLDEVTRGRHEGNTKMFKTISDITFLRQYYTFKDVQGTARGYKNLAAESLYGLDN